MKPQTIRENIAVILERINQMTDRQLQLAASYQTLNDSHKTLEDDQRKNRRELEDKIVSLEKKIDAHCVAQEAEQKATRQLVKDGLSLLGIMFTAVQIVLRFVLK